MANKPSVSQQGNANQITMKYHYTPNRMAIIKKDRQ